MTIFGNVLFLVSFLVAAKVLVELWNRANRSILGGLALTGFSAASCALFRSFFGAELDRITLTVMHYIGFAAG